MNLIKQKKGEKDDMELQDLIFQKDFSSALTAEVIVDNEESEEFQETSDNFNDALENYTRNLIRMLEAMGPPTKKTSNMIKPSNGKTVTGVGDEELDSEEDEEKEPEALNYEDGDFSYDDIGGLDRTSVAHYDEGDVNDNVPEESDEDLDDGPDDCYN
jgi:hypothetical protein